MPDIRPVSDLRNRFKEIERFIKKTGEPIFLTSNGRASMVLLSNEAYDKMTGAASGQQDEKEVDTFGGLIRKLLRVNEMTEEEMVAASGIPYEDLCEIMDDSRKPTEIEIEKLAAPLHVMPNTLKVFLDPVSGKVDAKMRKLMIKILDKIEDM